MLNVQLVIFPRLKRLVETSITFYCVIHKDGAPAGHKKHHSTTKFMHLDSYVLQNSFYHPKLYRVMQTDVESSTCRWLSEQQVGWVYCWWWVWLCSPCHWTLLCPLQSPVLSSCLWSSWSSWSPAACSPPLGPRRTGPRQAQMRLSGPSASWRVSYWASSLNKTRQRNLSKMREKVFKLKLFGLKLNGDQHETTPLIKRNISCNWCCIPWITHSY